MDTIIVSALEYAAYALPIVDALAVAWEVRHGLDPDVSETIAILQIRRMMARRAAGERAS